MTADHSASSLLRSTHGACPANGYSTALSRMPFVDSAELARVLGEPHATVHRALTVLLADGIAGRVSHGTAHLPSSQRYYLTAHGIREAAWVARLRHAIGLRAGLPHVQGVADAAHPQDGRSARRLPSCRFTVPLGIDGLRSRVEFHRRGRFDAIITLHDGRSFGVVRHGLALRRRSLYDRLRAIADLPPVLCPGTAPTALCPRTPEARS